jgi:hypothetical protein
VEGVGEVRQAAVGLPTRCKDVGGAFQLERLAWALTEPQPPDGELGEIEQGIRTSEGNAVIGAEGIGQAALAEEALESRGRKVLAGWTPLCRRFSRRTISAADYFVDEDAAAMLE